MIVLRSCSLAVCHKLRLKSIRPDRLLHRFAPRNDHILYFLHYPTVIQLYFGVASLRAKRSNLISIDYKLLPIFVTR